MNSFKTILALCVVMAASCSASSYRTQQSAWGSQPAAAAPLPLQNGGGYGNKVWGSAPSAVQPTFSAPAVQDAPLAPAPAQSSFPATTQQICTCVAVPAAAQQSAAPAPAAAAPLADLPLQQAAPQQTYSAPAAAPQQTWSAPAAAPAPVAAPAQFYSAPVQQAAAPAPLFRPAPSAAARPSYSTGY